MFKNFKDKKIIEAVKEIFDGDAAKPSEGEFSTKLKPSSEEKEKDYPAYLEYTPPSDEELLKIANDTYSSAYSDSINKAKLQTEKAEKPIYKSINGLFDDQKQKVDKEEAGYIDSVKKFTDSNFKKGVYDSSIKEEGLKALESQKVENVEKIKQDLTDSINKLNSQIDALESDLVKEIARIDEKYQSAIDLKLSKLKQERADKIEQVTKYNNELNNKIFYGGNGVKIPQVAIDRINEVSQKYVNYSDPVKAFKDFLSDDEAKNYLGGYYGNVFALLYKLAINAGGGEIKA